MDQVPVCAEMSFLACCLPNSSICEDARADLQLRLNWKRLISLAGLHGFLPLLCAKLVRTSWMGVPPETRKALQAFQLNNTRRCLAWSAALNELQGYCRYQGVPLLGWKGPLLAKELYGSITLREYADLDFLVRRADLTTVVGVLIFLGYTPHKKAATANNSAKIERRDHELCFVRPGDGIYLELHTQLMPTRFSGWQDADDFFQEVHWRPRVRSWTLRLPPEKLLLSLCGHGLKHSWERLKWLADVALIVEKYRDTVDWQALVESAGQDDKLDVLLHSLWLASSVFSTVLPVAIIRAARGKTPIVELTQSTAARIMSGQTKEENDNNISQQLALFFPSRSARFVFMLRRLLEPQSGDLDGRSVVLAKIRRLMRDRGVRGLVDKTTGAIRATLS